jgi:transposase
MYVFAKSHDRIAKERAMRKRKLKRLWARLKQLSGMSLTLPQLWMKLGAARNQYPSAWRRVEVEVDEPNARFTYHLRRDALRKVRRREGRYLLRTNLSGNDPAELWRYYIQLVQVEEAFKNLKGDLAIRPIYHQKEHRIEAHIFIAFLAYCLHATLAQQLRPHAPGLTPRSVFDKFAAVQMLDVQVPTTDGRTIELTRYTEPEPELRLLLERLRLALPAQAPPRITAVQANCATIV